MGAGPADRIAAAIGRRGPLPFSEVMEAALYDPEGGFYASGGTAGRRGDFLTSPEVGPLFGAVMARALDTWWREAGCPDPFVVVEAGAGPGTLCRAVLAAAPHCAPALRYVLVERSEVQRRRHHRGLPVVDPAFAFSPGLGEDPDDEPVPAPATGPVVVSLGELPRLPVGAVVIANELLDNLPFDLLEWRGGRWHEVRVGLEAGADPAAVASRAGRSSPRLAAPVPVVDPADPEACLDRSAEAEVVSGRPPALREVLVPLTEPPPVLRLLGQVPAPLTEGARIPVQVAAARWVRDALELARPPWGRLVVLDYSVPATAALARRPATEWLRTYRAHQRGGPPLDRLGSQDVTAEVAIDQLGLAGARAPDRVTPQADWLRRHGLDTLVEEGRRLWTEGAAAGNLATVKARSRITEAEALTDPAGLGAFSVLEWLPATPPSTSWPPATT